MYSKDWLRPTKHPIRTRKEIERADECKDHLQQGVSHREVINDDVRVGQTYDLFPRTRREY